jgi:hypothetical protein
VTQKYQMLDGTLTMGGQKQPISDAKMNGTAITFTAGGRRYTGQVNGSSISGNVDGGGGWKATRAG